MNEMFGIAICVASGLACFKMFMKLSLIHI